jgi:hypothetical protein
MRVSDDTWKPWYRQDPISDVAFDLEHDDCMESAIIAAMREHIEVGHNGCAAALEAFDRAVEEWRREHAEKAE